MGLIQQLALWHNGKHRIVGLKVIRVNRFITNGQKNFVYAEEWPHAHMFRNPMFDSDIFAVYIREPNTRINTWFQYRPHVIPNSDIKGDGWFSDGVCNYKPGYKSHNLL